jgi:hypothetical protein
MSATAYPAAFESRYAIGEIVVREETFERRPEGWLETVPAEQAKVTSVHFHPGKVVYGVAYESGRAAELVDSLELRDI